MRVCKLEAKSLSTHVGGVIITTKSGYVVLIQILTNKLKVG
jgi:hypothetical protein